jgi:hypothetical protein
MFSELGEGMFRHDNRRATSTPRNTGVLSWACACTERKAPWLSTPRRVGKDSRPSPVGVASVYRRSMPGSATVQSAPSKPCTSLSVAEACGSSTARTKLWLSAMMASSSASNSG